MKNPNLIQLWNKYYDVSILERFDLSKEWEYLSKHKEEKLSELIFKWNPNLSQIDNESILDLFETLGEYLDTLSNQDRCLFMFNILPIFRANIKKNRLDAVKSLINQVINIPDYGFRGIPPKTIIELTNNCNLNCIMCGVGSKRYSSKRTMPIELYKQIIEKVSSSTKTIRLNGLGESTVIPNFREYLSVLDTKNIQLELVTNLSMEDREILDDLLRMDFNLLISCDSPDLEHLAVIRRGLDIGNFINNLEQVKNYKRRDPMRNQFIFTIMKENFRKLPEMIELASQYNIGGVIGNMVKETENGWKHNMFNEIVVVFKKAAAIARDLEVELRLPDQIEGRAVKGEYLHRSNSEYCPTFKEEIFIRYNGDVCPCNMMNPYIYGNVQRNNLRDILNGGHARLFSKIVNTDSRHPYCEFCYYIR